MFPGHVDHPAVGVDVGGTFPGELVVLGVVGVMYPGVRRVVVEIRGYMLDDQVLRVHLAGANVGERRPVLPFEVLTRVGIIPPNGAVLRDRDAGRRRGAW